jgi:anti-anti-sigma regulatory factor
LQSWINKVTVQLVKSPSRITFDGLRDLAHQIRSHRLQPLSVDLSEVKRPSTLLFQLLLVAAETWRKDGTAFSLTAVPESLLEAMQVIGLPQIVIRSEDAAQ